MKEANQSERHYLAILRERLAREKLYGGPQRFPDLLTPEMERRVKDSLRIVNLEHAGAGRSRKTETLALKVVNEIVLLHSRGVLTDEQAAAAEILERDFIASGMTGIKALDYMRDRVDASNASNDAMADSALGAVDRYVAAIRVIPLSCWPVVRDVVIQGSRLDDMRTRSVKSSKLRRLELQTLLRIGLEELVQHYGLKRKKRRKHAKMNGHARPNAADFGASAHVENVSEGA